MSDLRFLHLDVFTDRPLSGNQLAVFPDARGVDARLMQRIANEMAFPETTFILPPERDDTDVRMRIFTPKTELPMAGHPTVGSTFALAHEGAIEPAVAEFVFGLGVGPTPVELRWSANRLEFAWMRQPLPEFGPTTSGADMLAAVLCSSPEALSLDASPARVVSCGVPLLFVPMVSREAVNEVNLDRRALQALCQNLEVEEMPVFVFSLEPADDGATVFSRMFAPIFGIVEDPATGGAGGPLGSYLLHRGIVSADTARHMISAQGVHMGRPSQIHISIGSEEGEIVNVRVGGSAVLVAEGSLRI